MTFTAIGAFVLLNAWFVAVNFQGWWASYEFQALRDADITSDSFWYWGLRSVDNGTLDVLVPILLGLSFSAALSYGWVRARRLDEAYPNLAVCAAILCAFLLFNKAPLTAVRPGAAAVLRTAAAAVGLLGDLPRTGRGLVRRAVPLVLRPGAG